MTRIGSVKNSKKLTVWERDGDLCHYCRQTMTGETRSIDHVWPRVYGGTNANSNLVAACRDCNSRLGDRTDKCRCEFCVTAMRAQWTTGGVA